MSNCSDCKDSILNNQEASLPDPQCQGDCPEITCTGISTYTDCVILTDTYSCIVPSGSTLSEALEEINTKLCAEISSNCGVQVTATDSCCGTLGNPSGLPDNQGNKIRSTSLAINIETTVPSGTCQYLSIEEKEWTWVNFSLNQYWENGALSGSYPPPSYGVKNQEVRLRGSIKSKSTFSYPFPYNDFSFFTSALPASATPSFTKRFQFIAKSSNAWFAVSIYINTNGTIVGSLSQIVGSTPANYTGINISLDHISYIK